MNDNTAIIQPEGELIHIPRHMLQAPLVIDAVIASFQHCPYAFNPVGMCHSVHKLFCAVVDLLMLVVRIQARVGRKVVGINGCTRFYRSHDLALQSGSVDIGNRLGLRAPPRAPASP